MGLINENEKLYVYRYKIDELKVVNGSDVKELGPFNVVDFVIEHDYIKNVFPFFKMTLRLNPVVYDFIVKNHKTVKFKVRILKFNENRETGEKSLCTEFINSMFSIYMDTVDSGFNKKQYNERKKAEGIENDEDDLAYINNLMEVFLFNDEFVDKLRGTVNFVMSSGTVGGAIGTILSKLGVSKVLMSPLENSSSYSPLIMPALSGVEALSYIDQNYGLYKKGSMMYFGLKRGYILNCKEGCTAYEEGEKKKTTFIISEPFGGAAQYFGSIRVPNTEETEYRIALPETSIDIESMSEIANALTGVNATVVSSKGSSVSSGSSGASTKGSAHSANFIDHSENKFFSSTFAAEQKRLETVITIAADETNIDAFEPNRDFSFIFENQSKGEKYKGSYLINKCTIHCYNGPEFQSSINAVFSKV